MGYSYAKLVAGYPCVFGLPAVGIGYRRVQRLRAFTFPNNVVPGKTLRSPPGHTEFTFALARLCIHSQRLSNVHQLFPLAHWWDVELAARF
jgi:hypothetical protein